MTAVRARRGGLPRGVVLGVWGVLVISMLVSTYHAEQRVRSSVLMSCDEALAIHSEAGIEPEPILVSAARMAAARGWTCEYLVPLELLATRYTQGALP